MNDERDNLLPLSPEGERRREAMIADAIALGGRLRRRRRVRKAIAIGAIPVAAIAFLARPSLDPRSPDAAPQIAVHLPTPTVNSIASNHTKPDDAKPDHGLPHLDVEFVAADPTALARHRVAPAASTIERVTDDDLMHSLSDAGMQGGLATMGSQTVLFVDGNVFR